MQLYWGQRVNDSTLVVDAEDVNHMVKSLRNQVGDVVFCIDGSGAIFQCEILQITKKEVVATIVEVIPARLSHTPFLHIGIALTKNVERIEWFVEKAVEIGIDSISFINCTRSVRQQVRMDRIMRIVRSAMKQSLNVKLPEVKSEVPFADIINIRGIAINGLIATCTGEERQPLKSVLDPVSPTLILIGPEGDFTSSELAKAVDAGFQSVSMGESRLRTETAGLVACVMARSIQL